MNRLFLGLDSSTQGLTGLLIDFDTRQIVWRETINYDADLPAYHTLNGVLRDSDPRRVHAPPLMWAEALDLIFARMREDGVSPQQVAAISGSAQQHGSVYLRPAAAAALAGLDPRHPLAAQLAGIFARASAPVWMDSSTAAECREIEDALGGRAAAADRTGSAVFERFTGPQIRKFWKAEPEGYSQTGHIALVSSFMAGLLAGRIAPLDHGDASGMNLMDIRRRKWDERALAATAPDLMPRLPKLVPSWQALGRPCAYWVARHGLNPDAQLIAWSGDNPSSAIGLGLIQTGVVAISLGTSDTYFGVMTECRTDPRGEGHVFVSPTGDYMTLICFQNGSLARERIRDRYGLDWAGFSAALRATPPGNNGRLMIPWFEPEIVPHVLRPGIRRFGLDESDAPANCRAVVEAQMLSMRIHSAWMGVRPVEIYATGGASANRDILQIMADVHQCPVRQFPVTNSAALGAALRAAHGAMSSAGQPANWAEIARGLAEPQSGARINPRPETAPIYAALAQEYAWHESANR